jgi:hypothetical protein
VAHVSFTLKNTIASDPPQNIRTLQKAGCGSVAWEQRP